MPKIRATFPIDNYTKITAYEVLRMSENPSFMVHWKARVLTTDHAMHEGLINQVRKGGFSMDFTQALSTGSTLSVEFYVKYKNEPRRIRAKARVTYCMVKSQSVGASLNLSILKMSKEDHHALSNVLQLFGDSDEFNLKV